jgi:uncharacterized membrane protein
MDYGPWSIDQRMKIFKDKDIRLLLSYVLRAGTIVSISVVFIGGIFFIYRHGQSISDYSHFNGIPRFIQNASGIFHGIWALHGQAMIQFGIVLLIATPILRVVFSAIGFVLEKDYMYLCISLLVLGIIFFSMMTGRPG